MNNIEDLKSAWEATTRRLEKLESQNAALKASLVSQRNSTALDRLATRYKRFSICALIMVFASVFYGLGDLFPRYAWQTVVFMIVYFIAAGLMDWWLYRGIRSIDVVNMTVSEVCEKAQFYRKRHLQMIVAMIPFAAVFVGWFIYLFSDDESIIWGACIGGGLGLLLGTLAFRRFMRDYRDISRE